jgi:hypothetical protein
MRRRRDEGGRTRTFRSLTHLNGRLKLTTLHTAGGLEFVVNDHSPEVVEAGPWSGMSGAPVWSWPPPGRRGHRAPPAEGAARLVVQPVQDL